MRNVPETVKGHWETPEGAEKARDTLEHYPTRESLPYGQQSDLAFANRVFMASRNDLDLGALQDAAKQRIRWLSVQLALANELLKKGLAAVDTHGLREGCGPELVAWEASVNEYRKGQE